ncbi:hypothetical protein DV738_g240, partial [Chaetothyriales sp. CBS 135597]
MGSLDLDRSVVFVLCQNKRGDSGRLLELTVSSFCRETDLLGLRETWLDDLFELCLPFYLILATIPALYGVYTFTKSKDNAITRFLDRFQANPGAESAKNAAVSVVVQKALEDRSLFSNAETDYSVDLRFPEKFNVGSPINVAPGESRANLEELKAFYTKKYQEAEERRVARASGKDRPDTKEIEARLGRSN